MVTLKQHEEVYKEILNLFNLVDDVIKAIEDPKVKNRHAQINLAEKFIATSSEGIEIILATYMEHVKKGAPATHQEARVIEDAARRIFVELINLTSQLHTLKPAKRA